MSREIAIKWYQQALHDLEMAEKNLKIEGYDISAFLAHQSVEKLLKSILILKGRNFPRTHQLDRLLELLELSLDDFDDIFELVEDYTLSRYPDASPIIPYLQYDFEASKKKVEIAKNVFAVLEGEYSELKE